MVVCYVTKGLVWHDGRKTTWMSSCLGDRCFLLETEVNWTSATIYKNIFHHHCEYMLPLDRIRSLTVCCAEIVTTAEELWPPNQPTNNHIVFRKAMSCKGPKARREWGLSLYRALSYSPGSPMFCVRNLTEESHDSSMNTIYNSIMTLLGRSILLLPKPLPTSYVDTVTPY